MMKTVKRNILTWSLILACSLPTAAQTAAPQLSADNIDAVVAAMTLEEKVRSLIGCGMCYSDDAKFPGTAGLTYAVPRVGLTSAYLADGPHRLSVAVRRPYDSRYYYCTEFPSGTTLAATFDVDAARRVGEAIGRETADYGLDILLAPGTNLHRTSLCGRNHEYYSEDPVVAGYIAAGYIQGVQSQGVGTSLKHFAVNNQETNRSANDARLDARTLRELYLKPFEIAVKKAQPWTIMTSYNKVNGTYTCESRTLNEDILRGEWGFKGLVMSDWNAGKDPVASIAAGNDMLQPGNDEQYNAILEAVKSGKLSEKLVNTSVKRLLQLIVKTKTFNQYKYPGVTDLKAHAAVDREVGAQGIVLLENHSSALPLKKREQRVALYGVTSYDIVPAGMGFGATATGYYCVSMVEGLRNAGFQLDETLTTRYRHHIADEERRHYPEGKPGFMLQPPLRAEELVPSAEELKQQAADYDVAVLTLGRTSGEGDDRRVRDFNLTDKEQELIRAVADAFHAVGKKLIVVLNVCGPIETASWRNQADGLVCAFQPGQEAGNAITDVLTGRVNPSGRLPMTWELNWGDAPADKHFPADLEFRAPSFAMGTNANFENKDQAQKAPQPEANYDYTDYDEGLYVGYRYFDTKKEPVAYPFGYGLSYTSFTQTIEGTTLKGDSCSMTVRVINKGTRPGREVVQAYVTAPAGGLDKPKKELKAFGKTEVLQPNQSGYVVLTWAVMDMASFNPKTSAWELPKGDYIWMTAASADDVRGFVTKTIRKGKTVKTKR